MDAPPQRLPRRDLSPRIPSPAVPFLRDRHNLGLYLERSRDHLLLRGDTTATQALQIHVPILLRQHGSHGYWCHSLSPILGNHRFRSYLPIGNCCCEPLLAADRIESGTYDVYMVDILLSGS